MTRKFVTLHDEAWVKENCMIRYDPSINDCVWIPKVYANMSMYRLSVLPRADKYDYSRGMYNYLVGETVEVQQEDEEPKMNSYGFRCAEGVPYAIPTWLVKSYWETQE